MVRPDDRHIQLSASRFRRRASSLLAHPGGLASRIIFVPSPPPSVTAVNRDLSPDTLCPLLTSDGSVAPLDAPCRPCRATHRQTSPGKNSHLPAYARRIYFRAFRAGTGLRVFWPSHPTRLPPMRFLFVGPAVCLRLPSDPASRRAPLPSTHRSPCRASRGLGMLRARRTSWREPMPGAAKKGPGHGIRGPSNSSCRIEYATTSTVNQ